MKSPEAAYKLLLAHDYLCQWGAWLREGNVINIGRLTSGNMGEPGGIFHEANEHRALAVQDVWAALVARSQDGEYSTFRRRTYRLYSFVLKLEYIEGRWARAEMVDHVSGKFRWPSYNERSLLNHLWGSVNYVGYHLGIRS